jgi:hypothetical protein
MYDFSLVNFDQFLGDPLGKKFFGEGLVLVVLVSGLFFGSYLVHMSNGFAGFIGHLTMFNLKHMLYKTPKRQQ